MSSPGLASAPRRGSIATFVALLCGVAFAALACASATPAPPRQGTGTAWGYLRLVPREGVAPSHGGSSPYADRRMRDVTFVDYSKPGFAVVYLEQGPSPRGSAELLIRTTGVRTRLDPPQAAVGAGGSVIVRNASSAAHVLSAPALAIVQRLEPGEQLELELPDAGEQSLFLLDVPRSEATLFVAPGPFAVVTAEGRYELRELAPGHYAVQAWHPRFPPTQAEVDLAVDSVVRLDLEMGVDQHEGPANAPANRP